MNNQTAKLIKSTLPDEGEISRRVYRRLKKEYAKMTKQEKTTFLKAAKSVNSL